MEEKKEHDEDALCGAVETVIFMSDRPISLEKIRKLVDPDLPVPYFERALSRLQEQYEKRHHGIFLQEVAGGHQFRTKAIYNKFVQHLFKATSLVLTPSALEALAIIAYKQPVSRVEIDRIRGVDSSHLVRGLMDKRLARIVGRADEVGRPVIYGTTHEFLEVFGLKGLEDLPPEHELQTLSQEAVGDPTDIKELISGTDSKQFVLDQREQLDELQRQIKGISADTNFTKDLRREENKRIEKSPVVSDEIRTAFDVLDEFVDYESVILQNQKSKTSRKEDALVLRENIFKDTSL